MDYPQRTKRNSSSPELLQKVAPSSCSALAPGASSSPGTAVAAFCAALSSNSQPLPNSAWLHGISPLAPQQSLYTSAREHGISAPNLCSQDWLRHSSPLGVLDLSRLQAGLGSPWVPQRFGEIINSAPRMQKHLIWLKCGPSQLKWHKILLRRRDTKSEARTWWGHI